MTNPVMKRFDEQSAHETVIDSNGVMTVNGAIQITAFLGIILVLAAAFVWSKFTMGYTDIATMLTGAGLIGGFVTALLIMIFRTKLLIPVYAACEGLCLGGISAAFETSYPGIVSQAVMGTFGALFSMLILYKFGAIKCTDKFRSVLFISTLSIAGIYLIDLIGRFFHLSVPIIHTSSELGILFSVIVVAIAALNLIIDFDFIEQGAQKMLPKDYEWFGAFGLMVTLVWVYLEILNLLAKLKRR